MLFSYIDVVDMCYNLSKINIRYDISVCWLIENNFMKKISIE